MKLSKQNRRDAKQLFQACQVNGALDETRVRNAVQLVVTSRPRGYVAILSYFHRLVKLDLQRRAAHIETAVPLGADLQGRVAANLARLYGPNLTLTFAQNPGLIGGLRVKVGCDVYDGTVQARLTALQETFSA